MKAGRFLIDDYLFEEGYNPLISHSRAALDHHGFSISEELWYGLTGGFGFIYRKEMRDGFPKVYLYGHDPALFSLIHDRLGSKLRHFAKTSFAEAWEEIRELISNSIPVLVSTDSFELQHHPWYKYVHKRNLLTLVGYDQEKGRVNIIDANPYFRGWLPIEALETAMTSPNIGGTCSWYTISPPEIAPDTMALLVEGIKKSVKNMLEGYSEDDGNVSVSYGLYGMEMEKLDLEVWSRAMPEESLYNLATGISYYIYAPTYGIGSSRLLFSRVLIEAAELLPCDDLRSCGSEFQEIHALWEGFFLKISKAAVNEVRRIYGECAQMLELIIERESKAVLRLQSICQRL